MLLVFGGVGRNGHQFEAGDGKGVRNRL
jgi:hypothetical protein